MKKVLTSLFVFIILVISKTTLLHANILEKLIINEASRLAEGEVNKYNNRAGTSLRMFQWGVFEMMDRRLKTKEITQFISGNVTYGVFDNSRKIFAIVQAFYPDGKYFAYLDGKKWNGEWKVKKNKFCLKYDELPEEKFKCANLYRRRIIEHNNDVTLEYFVERKGQIWQKINKHRLSIADYKNQEEKIIAKEKQRLEEERKAEEKREAEVERIAAEMKKEASELLVKNSTELIASLQDLKLTQLAKEMQEMLAAYEQDKSKDEQLKNFYSETYLKFSREKIKRDEEKRIATEKKKEEKRIATEKKKLSLLPAETDLQKAQHFLRSVENFVKKNPDAFDIISITEFLIKLKPVLEGTLNSDLNDILTSLIEFTNKSSSFVEYKKHTKEAKIRSKIKKVDEEIIQLKNYIADFETILKNNIKSKHADVIVHRIKTSKNIIDNATEFSQLKEANKSNESLILFLSDLKKSIVLGNDNIEKLKKYLKSDLTSDLASLTLNEVKSLQNAIPSENLETINVANATADKFIYKKFVEPEEKKAEEERIAEAKRIAEEERIAEAKRKVEEQRRKDEEAANKFHYRSSWGSEKLYDCKKLAKEAKKVKLKNMLGAEFKVLTLTNVTETINNRSELSCVGDARLSNGSNSKLIMRAFHVDEGTMIEVRQDQQDMFNKLMKELGQ